MITAQLTLAANRAVGLAMAWHFAIAVGIVALLLGVRPTRRAARVLLAVAIVSAAVVALGIGNPFNGTLLGVLGLALVLLALRLSSRPVELGPVALAQRLPALVIAAVKRPATSHSTRSAPAI
jgi:hypothetical protein